MATCAVVGGCGRLAFESHDPSSVCPTGYTFETATGSCYRTYTSPLSWLEAEAVCEGDGAHLVVIDDATEAEVAQRYLPAPAAFAWIGGTDQVTEGSYKTVLNQDAGYLVWTAGEPDGDDCLALVANQQVADSTCSEMNEYICEYDGKRPVSVAWGACPAGYTFSGTGCYRFGVVNAGQMVTWFDSETLCEGDGPGSHLLVIADLAELQAVVAFVSPTITDFWIGSSDLVTEGAYLAVTGDAFSFLVWAAGEPDGASEDCVQASNLQTVTDHDCLDGDDYVCEYDGIDPVPSAWSP